MANKFDLLRQFIFHRVRALETPNPGSQSTFCHPGEAGWSPNMNRPPTQVLKRISSTSSSLCATSDESSDTVARHQGLSGFQLRSWMDPLLMQCKVSGDDRRLQHLCPTCLKINSTFVSTVEPLTAIACSLFVSQSFNSRQGGVPRALDRPTHHHTAVLATTRKVVRSERIKFLHHPSARGAARFSLTRQVTAAV